MRKTMTVSITWADGSKNVYPDITAVDVDHVGSITSVILYRHGMHTTLGATWFMRPHEEFVNLTVED